MILDIPYVPGLYSVYNTLPFLPSVPPKQQPVWLSFRYILLIPQIYSFLLNPPIFIRAFSAVKPAGAKGSAPQKLKKRVLVMVAREGLRPDT